MGIFSGIIDSVFGTGLDWDTDYDNLNHPCPRCHSENATVALQKKGYLFCCKDCGLHFNSESVVEEIESLTESGSINEASSLLSYYNQISIIDEDHKKNECFSNYFIGEALVDNDTDYDSAKKHLKRAITLYEEDYPFFWQCMYDLYRVHKHEGDYSKARQCLLIAYQAVDVHDTIQVAGNEVNADEHLLEAFDLIDDKYTEEYLSLPYRDRKVLFITKDFSDLSQEHFTTLSIDSNLSQISFPMGHPYVNEMYIAHPLTTNKYYPIENYQLELVEERVREFCRMAQSLGAMEINIECLNSNTTNSSNGGSIHVSGDVSYERNKIGGEYRSEYNRRMMEEISRSINLHQVFQPNKAPELPKNLVWYDYEPSWQSIYSQRMEGGLIFEERIETKKSQVVDNREMKEIRGELQTLYANMNVAFDKAEEAKFEQQENAVLAISVKFAPLSQLTGETTNQQTSTYTANEQKYIDEVKECLADGEITKTGRRLLNMQRERLGISESRAAELEASVTAPQLTDEEKEYLEAYQETNENGQISDKERRTLNRLRDALGISEERAKEIEQLIR